ncbi:hypothetical protein LINGRAHAP2_LOCUS11946 [Linum grandiflorum]
MEDESETKTNTHLISSFLNSLRGAANDLHNNNPFFSSSSSTQPAIEAILELEHEFGNYLLSSDPNLFKLSQLLHDLKTLHRSLEKSSGDRLINSFLRRRIAAYRIHKLSFKIAAEIRLYFDRQEVQRLARTLQGRTDDEEEEEDQVRVMEELAKRLSTGFDREFQELVLKGRVFSILESILCDSNRSTRVREQAARAIVGLVKFNKDVFVGLVLMGSVIRALVSMPTRCSMEVLCVLVSLIRTPLIDEMELDGQLPRIVAILGSDDDPTVKAAAVECVCEIAYHGRKEVIEAMLELGVIKKLVELQRSAETDGGGGGGGGAFASCVARFAVQVEVGDGLTRAERKELKREIVGRVRDASVSEAEAASILAEVLWGSTP